MLGRGLKSGPLPRGRGGPDQGPLASVSIRPRICPTGRILGIPYARRAMSWAISRKTRMRVSVLVSSR